MRTLMTTAMALVLVAGAAVAADAVFFGGDDGERFDLSELNDGETRIFEAGEKRVTALREGDVVTLEFGEGGSSRCDLTQATCTIRTTDSHIMLSKEVRHECHGDDCDSNVFVMADDIGFGDHAQAHVMIDRISCEGDDCDDGPHRVIVRKQCSGGDCMVAHADGNVTVDVDTMGAGPRMMMVTPSGAMSMRWKDADDRDGCPEGSREMRYVDETNDDGYLCVTTSAHAGGHGVFVVSPGDDIDWVQKH